MSRDEETNVADSAATHRYFAGSDDGEPITEGWLKSIGGEEGEPFWGHEFYDASYPVWVKRSASQQACWSVMIGDTTWPCDVWTRGCLRRIFVALQRDVVSVK